MPRKTTIRLRPAQSVAFHGWMNPRQGLCWEDIQYNQHLTVSRLLRFGLTQANLIQLQPDVYECIQHKYVGFEDVPLMSEFPLHPITHLHGDVSTLVQYRYNCKLLQKLNLGYKQLRVIGMNSAWMKMLNFSFKEWMDLGLTIEDINAHMTDDEVMEVFGTCRTSMALTIGLAKSLEDH